MQNLVSLVLGGGAGTRLFPLTKYRSKPAVPLAGKYRIIDIPISNCLNSGMNRIYLLTQFNSVSLHRHIRQTYMFDRFSGGFVEILAAQQTIEGASWYQGTADAVRKNLRYLEQYGIEYVLILSGDQLYRMDYRQMLKTHIDSGAEATIAAVPVTDEAAKAFGIMQLSDDGRVIGFKEKPQTEAEVAPVRMAPEWIEARGIPSKGRSCMASMGIYLFNRNTLVDLLQTTTYEDFGKQIFPMSIASHKVQVHLFDGYWEDIGTIRSFFEANLALATRTPPFEFASKAGTVYTRARFLPPTRIEGASVKDSLVSDGCVIEEGAVIENSVIGLRCRIGRNAVIRDSVLMGADFYESDTRANGHGRTRVPLGVGAGAKIEGAIVDKNCRIGNHAEVIADRNATGDADLDQIYVRDGILVVPKDTMLTDGWRRGS